MRLRRIVDYGHGWTRLTILCSGNSLLSSVNALEPGFRPSVRWGVVPRWCSPIGKPIESPPFDARITRPWPRARQFPIVVRSGERPRRQHPRAFEGQGHMAIRGRRSGVPSAHGQTVGHAPNARHRSHRRLISDRNGRDPRSGARPPLRRFGLALVPPSPVLGGFLAVMPRFVPPCAGSDCVDPPPGVDPPGSGLFCRKTGPNLTLFRGSGRLFRFLAAIRVDGYGITPGQKHSHRRCPVPQPTKPPRTLLRRCIAWCGLTLFGHTKPPRTLLGRLRWTASAPSPTTYKTARSFARAFSATPVPGNEKPTKPPRTLLGRFGPRIRLSVELPTKPPKTSLGR